MAVGNCTNDLLRRKELLLYSGTSGTDLGDYENCVAQEAAHHCTFSLTQKPPATTPQGHLGLPLAMLGVCAPRSCTASDLEPMILKLLPLLPHGHTQSPSSLLNGSVMNLTCAEDISVLASDLTASLMLGVLVLLIFLALTGTIIENQKKARFNFAEKVALSFSVPRNFQLLFEHKEDKTNFLNGIRYLSILWIIFGHLLVFTRPGFRNLLAALPSFVDNYSVVLVSTATFCVDTFFFMGGFLQAYVLLQRIHKLKGRFAHGVPSLYLLRYLRLTPLLAFVIFAARLLKYAGHGAIWFHFQRSTMWAAGEKYWWAVLFYLNDYVPYHDGYSGGPFQWTWYLANDFQFFLITPPLILLYIYVTKRGVVGLLCLLMLGSLAANAQQRTFVQQDSYSRPTNRCPPYIWGLLGGMLLHRLDEETQSLNGGLLEGEHGLEAGRVPWKLFWGRGRHVPVAGGVSMEAGFGDSDTDSMVRGALAGTGQRWTAVALFLVHHWAARKALYLLGLALLASGSWLQSKRVLAHFASVYRPDMGMEEWGLQAQSCFSAYYMFCWGLGLMLVTTPWAFGYGGLVRRVLEHRAFSALAKLTYGVYLLHPFVNMWLTYQANTWFILSMTNLTMMWIAFSVVTTLLSFCCWMLVEKPVSNVLELFMKEK
eukprot:EG_transcript_4804